MPGAKDYEDKKDKKIEKELPEKEGGILKRAFGKLKDVLKKGLDAVRTAATGLSVRILGGRDEYVKWVEKNNTAVDTNEMLNAKAPLKVGDTVVCRLKDKTFIEGKITGIIETEDSKRLAVEFCDGRKEMVPADEVMNPQTFTLKNQELPDGYKMILIDSESIEKYKAMQQEEEKETSENREAAAEEEVIEETEVEDENISNEDEEINSEAEANDKEAEEINSDAESPAPEPENIPADNTEEAIPDDMQDEEIETEDAFEPIVPPEADVSEPKKAVTLSLSQNDIKEGDHVLYAYKGKYQEAEVTAINKKTVDIALNDGREFKVKKPEIETTLFGYNEIKDNKIMSQCVNDLNNTKFSDSFRQAYQDWDLTETLFSDNSDNFFGFDEVDIDDDENTEPEGFTSLDEQIEDAKQAASEPTNNNNENHEFSFDEGQTI